MKKRSMRSMKSLRQEISAGLMLSMNFLIFQLMSLLLSTLELLPTLLKVVVFSILWRLMLLMKNLRLTSERLKQEQLLQEYMTPENMVIIKQTNKILISELIEYSMLTIDYVQFVLLVQKDVV